MSYPKNQLPVASHSRHRSRRRLIKAMAGSSVILPAAFLLPERWIVPVVDSVLLPAHARGSGATVRVVGSSPNCNEDLVESDTGSVTFAVSPAPSAEEPCLATLDILCGGESLLPPISFEITIETFLTEVRR